jgi:predicted DCC family thiol-disulfide oxidoreductase YuxK
MNTYTTNGKNDIILFDGTCNLCNGVVNFIKRHDKRGHFCFVPLESEKASEYINNFENQGMSKGSLALISNGKIYLKSDAVLHILKCLDGLWPALYIFKIVPRLIRDPVYNIFARYRYKLIRSKKK